MNFSTLLFLFFLTSKIAIAQSISKERQIVIDNFKVQAKKAGLDAPVIDSLLFYKQKYILINERISKNAKLRDSLYLFSRDYGTKKSKNFNNYRKKISSVLSHEKFYELYKSIIDPEIQSAVQEKIDYLKNNYVINVSDEQILRDYLFAFKKQTAIIDEYYIYNKKLTALKKAEIDQLLAFKIQKKIDELGLKPKASYSNFSNPSKATLFINKAVLVGIEKERALRLSKGIEKLKNELQKSIEASNVRDLDQFYMLDDVSYHSSLIFTEKLLGILLLPFQLGSMKSYLRIS